MFLRRMGLCLAVLLLGCESPVTTSHPVLLVTDPEPVASGEVLGCLLNWEVGELVAHPMGGTALKESSAVVPLVWPAGYTGRRVEGILEISDAGGRPVARTGERYKMWRTDGRPGFVVCDVAPE